MYHPDKNRENENLYSESFIFCREITKILNNEYGIIKN